MTSEKQLEKQWEAVAHGEACSIPHLHNTTELGHLVLAEVVVLGDKEMVATLLVLECISRRQRDGDEVVERAGARCPPATFYQRPLCRVVSM